MAQTRKALTDRWDDARSARIWATLIGGGDIAALDLARTDDGRWDLRGITSPPIKEQPLSVSPDFIIESYQGFLAFVNRRLSDVDFTFASLPHLRFTDSVITNCVFDQADLTDIRLWTTDVVDSRFVKTKLKPCQFGAWTPEKRRGNSFTRVHFQDVNFVELNSHAGYFRDCRFVDVKMVNRQFFGTIFEHCQFSGVFRDCRFDGRPIFADEYPGWLGPNQMLGCDFSGAVLDGTAFTGIDTRAVALPADEELLVIDDFASVMSRAVEYIDGQSEPEQQRLALVRKLVDRAQTDVTPGQQNYIDLKIDKRYGEEGARDAEATREVIDAVLRG